MLMVLWARREPWDFASIETSKEVRIAPERTTSPDRCREKRATRLAWSAIPTMIEIIDTRDANKAANLLCVLHVDDFAVEPAFKDDDTFTYYVRTDKETEWTLHTYRRRHPEWWWGHFYRPEVWLSLVLLLALITHALRSRKKRGANE